MPGTSPQTRDPQHRDPQQRLWGTAGIALAAAGGLLCASSVPPLLGAGIGLALAGLCVLALRGVAKCVDASTAQVEPVRPEEEQPRPAPNATAPADGTDALQAARARAFQLVSHEMRTPLTSILAASEILKRCADGEAGARSDFVDIIEHEARRLLGFVGNVLEAGKLEQGEVELVVRVHDLAALAERVAAESFARLREGRVTLSFVKPPGKTLCRCDGERIEQLVRTLLEESIRWSPSGGVLRLAITRRDDAALVRIVDEGPPPQRVVGPQPQLPNTTVRESGLAFEVGKRIAELHGFDLRLEAGEAGGCAYVLTVPASALVWRPAEIEAGTLDARFETVTG